MSSSLSAPSFDEIRAAQSRLRDIAICSPLLKLDYQIPGVEIYLKCEQFQLTSSFKIRGAANIVKILSMKQKENGIVTASSGNMAQGLSWIAREENVKCRILVPDTTNEVKLKAIERLSGEITKCTFDEWFQVILSGQCPMLDGYFIHPVRDRHVMAGHGTIALEILDQLPDCDAILVPYGGGGLITGIVSAVKHLKQSIDVFACEIETAAPLSAALNAGEIVKIPIKNSWVDAIGHASIMKEMWPLVKDCIDGSIVVTLKETADALKLLIERNHMICEGASATALAAALWHYPNLLQHGKAGLRRKPGNEPIKVVVILSGAGIGTETIIKCLNETL
ncbi:unnamed protein product [Rotaria sp. Silwood1]|nr:unnamed protein product [Rotaria sp. Silwood1]CAF3438338.1 unnamed protein product [Rotaria sp. Silwood1]CAF3557249.1 unnamed protein product [Rotaria sp. Silwood1]CAF3581088.1 unnamed protein product [Rotaria sp. Silwood1]CAF4579828.1 unnamed protein product [Rotaria sp. Silwood1]